MGTSYQEVWTDEPLSTITPAYLYRQYADDADLQAFISVANGMSQAYLNWFLTTPLAIYTNPNISGSLLNWVGTNLYGLSRPSITTAATSVSGAMNTAVMNSRAMNLEPIVSISSSVLVTDDVYKRCLTWALYKGDGMHVSLIWLRRRIARFLYGTNGGDIPDLVLTDQVSLQVGSIFEAGSMNSRAMNSQTMNTLAFLNFLRKSYLEISIPVGTISQTFASLFGSGVLQAPFQLKYEIVIQ